MAYTPQLSATDVPFDQTSHTSVGSDFRGNSRTSLEVSASLAHAERSGTAQPGSWAISDIDWRFAFRAQHYGTLFFALFIVITLAIIHYTCHPRHRPFFLYDASISYISGGDTVPAAVAVVIPLISLFVSLCCYEFWVYKLENWHITNAVATVMHFVLDGLCAFLTAETFTEATKVAAGRLRPDFFQQCQPSVGWTSGVAELGVQRTAQCTAGGINDGRKSFCSGHASTSAVLIAYNIVYLLWAGKPMCPFKTALKLCIREHRLQSLLQILIKNAHCLLLQL